MTLPPIRIGQGFDVHPFVDDPDRPLVLGGVVFESERALRGHSDSDVIAHAVTDALLGAAGIGDIGSFFPDTDDEWAGADSIELLAEATRRVRDAGWVPVNVDVSVVAEEPKLASKRAIMQERLGTAVGAPVTVKGKRPEGLGSLGRREGIAAWAVALVARTADDGDHGAPGAADGGGGGDRADDRGVRGPDGEQDDGRCDE